jgi:hypothetical protein
VAVSPSGQPAISYRSYGPNSGDRFLKYAWFDGSAWQRVIVDSSPGVDGMGWCNSLALLASGQPAIAYATSLGPTCALKFGSFDGASWHTGTVDASYYVGYSARLAILRSGRPAVAYAAPYNGSLQYAERVAPSGDTNCDGQVNLDDIEPFVVALVGRESYQAAYPNCRWLNADINEDGRVTFDDINPFVELLVH